MASPGRRRRLSDWEVRVQARDLVRRGAWKGLRIRETGLAPARGRPRPGEVPLLTALAAETHYSERALRRILAGHDRDGRQVPAEGHPGLLAWFQVADDDSPPVYAGYAGPGGLPVLTSLAAPSPSGRSTPPMPGARGLDAVGLSERPADSIAPPATSPDAWIREGLLEHLDAALATPGVLPDPLRGHAETLSRHLLASVASRVSVKNPAANRPQGP